jgi:ATP-dependent RNA helicase DDX49/DBP8
MQIAEQLEVFGAPLQLRIAVIIGGRGIPFPLTGRMSHDGVDMIRQALQLDRKPHIIVATPGRLADHISSTRTLKLNRLRFLVLDEADRMLDTGFDDEMKSICAILPKTYQLLLFSATMSPVIDLLEALLILAGAGGAVEAGHWKSRHSLH